MRKFIIKNRQKRRYIKKTKNVHTFSFSKAFSGMMPVLVMIIAFMATIVISTSFRNSLTNMHITFQFPEISWHSPLEASKSFLQNTTQIGIALSSGSIALLVTAENLLRNMRGIVATGITSINVAPFLLSGEHVAINTTIFLKTFFSLLISFLYQDTVLYTKTIILGEGAIVSFAISTVLTAITYGGYILTECLKEVILLIGILERVVTTAFVFISSFAFETFDTGTQVIAHFIQTAIQLVIFAGSALFVSINQFITLCIQFLWGGIMFVVNVIGITVGNIAAAIIHFIEIPFRILNMFWLQIKPYVIILGKHVQMTGGDFSNGFNSLEKFPSLINAKN